jgi:uncharacterized protein (TIGR03437 family)
VFFDEFSAPQTYASPTQINVQVPWEIAGRASTVVSVANAGLLAGRTVVSVRAAQPGIFYVVNSDGSRNSAANPAVGGDFVSIYATGGGAMSVPGATGMSWPLAPLSFLMQAVSVSVSVGGGKVVYAGSVPTLGSGFFQLNVQTEAAPGGPFFLPVNRMITLTVGGVASVPFPIWIEH